MLGAAGYRMNDVVSINGQLVAADAACVSVFDSGFTQGIGLFETMRAVGGRIFRLDRHLERLRGSAGRLGWTVIPEPDELRNAVRQVVRATGNADARVRLTVTTGSVREAGDGPPALTVVATAAPGGAYPEACYQSGVTVVIGKRYRQSAHDPTAGHKTTSYFARMTALREAYLAQAFESLWFTPEDMLAEGSISSVFLVLNECLVTPPLETPVLPGVTRGAVLELAAREGIAVAERPVTVDEVLDADELFLTNSMMGVMPVVRIERWPLGGERPGEITRRIAAGYADLVRGEATAHAG